MSKRRKQRKVRSSKQRIRRFRNRRKSMSRAPGVREGSGFEALEQRILLSASMTYVDQIADLNEVTDNGGQVGVIEVGDVVEWGSGAGAVQGTFGTEIFDSIQAAINNTGPQGTVNVADGTFSEDLIIDDSLTLQGAQAGVDATDSPGSRGPESIITASSPFGIEVRADDVTIDGFEITGYKRDGINVRATTSGPGTAARDNVVIQNNHIHTALVSGNQANALVFGESTINGPVSEDAVISNVTIAGNYFDIDDDNTARGIAMTNQFTSIEFNGFEISGNTIKAKSQGLFASANTSTYLMNGLEVVGNRFEKAGSLAINIGNLDATSKINDNTFINNSSGAAVNWREAGGKILNNTFEDHTNVGLYFFDDTYFPQSSADATVSGNSFVGNNRHVGAPAVAVDLGAIKAGNTFDGTAEVSGLRNIYGVIQAAIDAATAGDTVTVGDGLYVENLLIDKDLTLLSENGRGTTTIEGISGAGALGAIQVTNTTTGVQIGDAAQGFTIIGIDNGAPGIENAAVYFQGGHSGATVRGNEIQAAGDAGLLTEYGASIDGFVIDGNEFSGQTFVGAQAGGIGFGSQFSTANVPRQLVVMGGGTGGGNTSNVTFTNNVISGVAGGISSVDGVSEQGNTLVTIDSAGATITGNSFEGTTTRYGAALRARGSATVISGNVFDATGMSVSTNVLYLPNPNTGNGLSIDPAGMEAVIDVNTFIPDELVVVNGASLSVATGIQAVIDAAPAGTDLRFSGSYTENVDVNKAVTIGGDFALDGTLTVSDGGATLDAGYSPGIITSSGLALTAGSTLTAEVNGTTPGSGHDQYVVNGTVDLGAATLDAFGSITASVGDTVVLIDNDGTDPVTGQFTGIAQASEIAINGESFAVFYDGGDGNDVTLVRVPATQDTVYVDEDWAGTTLGDDPDPGDAIEMVFGYNAFASIQEGVDAVDVGGDVLVYETSTGDGDYDENVGITRSMTVAAVPGESPLIDAGFGIGFDINNGSTVSLAGLEVSSGIFGINIENAVVDIDSTIVRNASATGITVDNDGELTLSASEVRNSNAGIQIVDGTADIAGSIITGHGTGVLVNVDGGASIFNSNLAGNTGFAVQSGSPTTVDASGNWWGSNVETDVQNQRQGNVDFTPFLVSGTDTDGGAVGFDGDFAHLRVTTLGGQSGSDGRIQEAVDMVDATGLVTLLDGQYNESNTTVGQPLTLEGQSRAGVVIAPEAEDDNVDSTFGGTSQQGLIVAADDVTIERLTIDGQANSALTAGKNNFRMGIVQDVNVGQFNATVIDDVTVQNIYRRGIQVFTTGTPTSGHAITNSTIQNVELQHGIYLIGGDGLVSDNIIDNVGGRGIGTALASSTVTGNQVSNAGWSGIYHYNAGMPNSTAVEISGNTVTGVETGLNLVGLTDATTIGGANVAEGNIIDLTGDATAGVGMLNWYNVGQPTIQNNQITGEGGDSGAWIFHNEDPADAPVFRDNVLMATGSDGTNPGEGTGFFLTNDGTFFGDENGWTYAELYDNQITGFARGIDLHGSNSGNVRTVHATLAGNQITGAEVGLRLFERDGAAGAGADEVDGDGYAVQADILDDLGGITGNTVGVSVDNARFVASGLQLIGNDTGVEASGADATVDLSGGAIQQAVTGVDLSGGAALTLAGVDFDDATMDNTVDLSIAADAGAVSLGGGNSFAGETYFIENLSPQDIDATGEAFDESDPFRIEDKLYHGPDASGSGLVRVVAGEVHVTAPGTGASDETIQNAIDAADAGDIVNIEGGATYDQAVIIDKALTLLGDDSVAAPTVTRTSGSDSVVIEVVSDDVTIDSLDVVINRPNSTVGIGASNAATSTFTGGSFDNLTVRNTTVTSAGSGGTVHSPFLSVDASGIALLGNGTPIEAVTLEDNTVDITTSDSDFRRRAVFLREVQATVTGNDLTGQANDLIFQFASSQTGSGLSVIDGNTFRSGGLDITEPNASSAGIEITNNDFLIAGPTSSQSLLLKNVDNAPTLVQGNTFEGHTIGISMGSSSDITIDDNTFSAPTIFGGFGYADIVIDTGNFTGGSPAAPFNPVTATVTNNTFNGFSGANPDDGVAILLANSNPGAAAPDFGALDIGTAGNENAFHADVQTFIALDLDGNGGGGPVEQDFEISNNLFDMGSGLQSPGAMTLADQFGLESRLFHKIDNAALGLLTWTADTIYVTPADTPTATDNDYTRLRNALEAAEDGFTIALDGTFDWTEPNAAASWALGNDGVADTGDDYGLVVPSDLDNVTLTAPGGLGTATIQGPGDLGDEAFEGFLFFETWNNQDWTISNLTILDFDWSIGMFFDSASTEDNYDNMTITNNRIVMARDVLGTDANEQAFQNAGIHYAGGVNQTFSNNIIEIPGDGLSDSANSQFTASIAMMSNTHGGDAYDGLQIVDNQIRVLNAQSADPEIIYGIWENGHAHSSNLTISGNSFTNLDAANDPTLNLQRAFELTSHASASTTVTYADNQVDGANVGFRWQSYGSGTDFSGHQPIVLTGNTVSNAQTAILIRSNGSAMLSDNDLSNSGPMLSVGTGVEIQAGSSATIDDSVADNDVTGFATGILARGDLTLAGNDSSITANAIGVDVDGGTANLTGNAIADNGIGVRFTNGGDGSLVGNDFDAGATADNTIDVQLTVSAGTVTLGGGNTFAGDDWFIENLAPADLDATGETFLDPAGSAYSPATLADAFAIEDQLFHAPDAPASGLVRVVAGEVFVTTPATGLSDETIQNAIDVADAGDTVHVQSGTYAENLDVHKRVTLDGAGAGSTIVDASGGNVGIDINASGLSAGDRLAIRDLAVQDAGSHGFVASSGTMHQFLEIADVTVDNAALDGMHLANIDDLVLTGITATNNGFGTANPGTVGAGIRLLGVRDAVVTDTLATDNFQGGIGIGAWADTTGNTSNITIDGGTFSNPASTRPEGTNGINFYLDDAHGPSSISDVTITGTIDASDNLFAGIDLFNAGLTSTISNVQIGQNPGDSILLSGNTGAGLLLVGNVDDVQATATFQRDGENNAAGAGIFALDESGTGSPSNVSLDGSSFDGYSAADPAISLATVTAGVVTTPSHVIAANDVSALNTTFNGVDVNTASTADFFAIEDQVVHAIDVDGAGVVNFDPDGGHYLTPNSFVTGINTLDDATQRGIDATSAGDTLFIQTGAYNDTEQVNVDHTVAIVGEGPAATTFAKSYDTGSSGDSRGWWLVDAGVNLDLSGVGFDGSGTLTYQGIRHKGAGTIDNVAFSEIKFNESGPTYSGVGVAYFAPGGGNLDITNSQFSEIGRIGAMYFGSGVTGQFSGNTYTGKGAGDWLDYALDISAGAQVDVTGNIISDNLGVASSDGSTSAGVLASTFFGPDTTAELSGNQITNSTTGVFVGYDSSDTSVVTVDGDTLTGNDNGIVVVGGKVTVEGNAIITGNGEGVEVRENGEAIIRNADLSGNTDTGVDVDGGAALIENTDLTGNLVGIRAENGAIVDAGDLSASNQTGLGSSVGNNDLSGYTGAAGNFAVEDLNLAAEPDVFAENNDWGLIATPAAIEQVVFDDTDDATRSSVIFSNPQNLQPAPAVVYVDDDWTGLALGDDPDGAGPATAFGVDAFNVVQDGVDAVQSGGDVHVFDGIYTEAVDVDKPLSMLGQAGATLDGAGLGPVTGLEIHSSDVTVDNMTVRNFGGNGIIVGYEPAGPGDLQNIVLTDNTIHGIQPGSSHGFGLYVGFQSEDLPGGPSGNQLTDLLDYSGLVIAGNEIYDTANATLVLQSITSSGAPIEVTGNNLHDAGASGLWIDSAQNIQVAGNTIDNNANGLFISGFGDGYYEGTPDGQYDPRQIAINSNFITNNDTGVNIYDGWPAELSIHDNDLSGNTTAISRFGSLGGAAIDARGNWFGSVDEATVEGLISGAVDFTPYLASGDADGVTPGFQADYAMLYVTDAGEQLGATGRVQEAIDLVTSSTVYVNDGVYTGAVTVNTSVDLLAVNQHGAVLDFTGQTSGIQVTASDVLIDGFDITGDASTVFGVYVAGQGGALSDITLSNNLIHGMAAPHGDFDQSYGLLVDSKTSSTAGSVSNLNVTGNEFYDLGDGTSSSGVGLSLHEISGASAGDGVTVTGNAFRDIASVAGSYLSSGIGVGLHGTGDFAPSWGSPSSGGDISGNTYENVALGVFAYATNTTVDEDASAFTNADIFVLDVGRNATVEPTGLEPYARADTVAPLAPFAPAGLEASDAYTPLIQTAIDISEAGGTVHLSNGTFGELVEIDASRDGLTLLGAGSGATTLDISGGAAGAYGLTITADDITVEGMTISSSPAATQRLYGIKAQGYGGTVSGANSNDELADMTENLVLRDIEVTGLTRSGIDFNGVDGALVEDVNVHDNGGAGLFMTDARNVTFDDVTGTGNAWGDLIFSSWGQWAPIGVTGIGFSGTNNLDAMVIEEGNYDFGNPGAATPHPITWGLGAGFDVDVTNAGFDFALSGGDVLRFGRMQHYTTFHKTLGDAETAAAAVLPSDDILPPTDRYIVNTAWDTFHVYDNVDDTMSIQAAVDQATSGDVINVYAGTFEENVTVGKTVTIDGQGNGTIVDAGGGIGIELLAGGDNVTLQDLRITDAGSGGVRTDAAISNLSLDGVQVDGSNYGVEIHNNAVVSSMTLTDVSLVNNSVGFRVATSGHVDGLDIVNGHIDNNNIGIYTAADNGSTTNEADFTDIEITGTTFDNNSSKGIYAEKLDNATLTNIQVDNSGTTGNWGAGVDVNLKYGAYENIDFVGGTVSNSGTGDPTNGVGLTVKARGTGNDSSYAGNPATLDGVNISGVQFTANQAGVRIGEPGKGNTSPTSVSITGNTFTGNPVDVVVAGGVVSVSGNNYATMLPILVSGGTATITETITGATDAAVRVTGAGNAIVTGSTLTGGNTGVEVDGGTALIESTDLNGNTIGVLIENGGVADLGDGGHTALGTSAGGNDFSAYTTAASATDGAIVNLNTNAPNDQVGPQGLPDDIPAFANTFFSSAPGDVESVIHHDADDNNVGFVDYAGLAGLSVSLDTTTIDENDTVTLSGSFTNDPQEHTLTIDWGDGNTDTIFVPQGTFDLSTLNIQHTYLDDAPSGDASNSYNLSVTLSEDAGPDSLTDNSLAVTVNNVDPTLDTLAITSPIDEGGTATLSGTYADPGTQDTFELDIDWDGDNVFDQTVTVSGGSFSVDRQYLDDDPTGTPADSTTVNVQLRDDDTGSDTGSATLTVENVAPQLGNVNVTAVINEDGTVALTGDIVDPGTLDALTLDVDWGDGSPIETFSYGAGTTSFSETHQYLDDDPSGSPSDSYTIGLTITDDDTGVGTASVSTQVDNVAPTLDSLSVTPTSVDENGTVTLDGTFSDPGSQDTFELDIDWDDDGNYDQTVSVSGGSFSVAHQYLDDDPTGTLSDTFDINVQLRDDDTGSDTGSVAVTVDNVDPVASITGAPATSPEGTAINLSASVTDIGSLDTFTYDWAVLKDGSPYTTGAGASFSFTPDDGDAAGTDYQIQLTVTDDDGGVATDTVTIDVQNVAPTLDLTGNATVDEGATYTLDVDNLVDPGLDAATLVVITWGDGDLDSFAAGDLPQNLNHVYDDGDEPNTPYTITATVHDEDGQHTAATLPVAVQNVAPTAIALNGGAVNEGSNGGVEFFVFSNADPSPVDTAAGFRFAYDFDNDGTFDLGDGTYAGSTASASATVPGSYLIDDPAQMIGMRIIDIDGGYTDYFTNITINNVAPTVDAGADDLAFAGSPFNRTIAITDPGEEGDGVDDGTSPDIGWHVQVDFDGDSAFDQAFYSTSRTPQISHTYGPADVGNTYTVTVQVDDQDGGSSTDTFDLQVVNQTFRVVDFQPTASGFKAQFNGQADLADLNLYDGIDSPVESADLSLVGATVGQVDGSMVWDSASQTLTFARTGGVLPADTYTLTLTSSADAFNKDGTGALLDGNGDFTAGGDYVTSFTTTTAPAVVSMPDFARGAGQAIDVTPANPTDAALPISISNANSVTAVDLDLRFDPALLSVNAVTKAAGLPSDWTVTVNNVSPGLIKLTASGTTALSGSNVAIYELDAEVPATAPYGSSQVIELENLRVNEDAIPSRADAAVHKAVYLGDTDGNAIYTAFDSSFISRVVVDLDTGFDAHDWTDPRIVADATADGTLSGLDASYVAQKGVGLTRPEIPDLPGIVTIPASGGVDPELNIDLNIPGGPGSVVTAPVDLDVLPIENGAVLGASVDVFYDPATLSITNGDIAAGTLTTSNGWSLTANVVSPGHLRFFVSGASASPVGQGEIALLDFTVDSAATSGATALDVEPVDPSEGGLTWTQSDGSILIDADAPTVEQVYTRGTAWGSTFLNYLDNEGLGDADFGYAIPADADQLKTLPWINLDELSVTFSEPVTVSQSDLGLFGVNVADYGSSVVGFTYDAASNTATWELSSPIQTDKLLLHLPQTITDAVGNPLDGEHTTGDGLPSGDGAAGGDHEFRFNVLPGDVNGDDVVLGSDTVLVRDNQFAIAGSSPNYNLRHDLTGDGVVLGSDTVAVRDRQFSFLPAGTPSAPLALNVQVIEDAGEHETLDLLGSSQNNNETFAMDRSIAATSDGSANEDKEMDPDDTLADLLNDDSVVDVFDLL